MILYRISLRDANHEHKGYEYVSGETRAMQICERWHDDGGTAEYKPIEVVPTKKGLMAALNQYGGHADNG